MRIDSFLNSLNKNVRRSTRGIVQMSSVSALSGIDIGIPLNIIQNVFTKLHYGYDITTLKMVLLQFVLGYYTYGKDRYLDALEWDKKKYITRKQELFQYLIENKEKYKILFDTLFFAIVIFLTNEEGVENILPFLGVLLSTDYYKDIKKIAPIMKPLYISILWTLSVVILPCLLNDNSYEILSYPMDYLPCTLTMFSSSVILDIRDIEEDKDNNVDTIPVKYGLEKTKMIVIFLLGLSNYIFGINNNYLTNIGENVLFEMLNLGLIIYVFMKKE